MTFTRVSAELIVADHDAAVAWYQRLFGRPPDTRPMSHGWPHRMAARRDRLAAGLRRP